jgi:hypothetical protein
MIYGGFMITPEDIRNTINKFDPEFAKNEADLDIDQEDEKESNISIDAYQRAIDDAADPEDLNFVMHDLDNDADEIEEIPIPQKDYEEEPIKVGDSVKKITRDQNAGTVLAVGELVEVEWNPEEVESELDKVVSLETDPPIPLSDLGKPEKENKKGV